MFKTEWVALLVTWLALAVLNAGIDGAGNDSVAILLGSFFDMVAYVVLNFRLVRSSGRGGEFMRPRAAGFIALGILSGLAILAGLLLLLLPGIYLYARWYWAYPILVADDTAVTDAMRRSWHLTRGRVGLVGFIAIGPFVPGIALVALTLLLPLDTQNYGAALAFELPMTAITLLTTLLPVASWSALTPADPD